MSLCSRVGSAQRPFSVTTPNIQLLYTNGNFQGAFFWLTFEQEFFAFIMNKKFCFYPKETTKKVAVDKRGFWIVMP